MEGCKGGVSRDNAPAGQVFTPKHACVGWKKIGNTCRRNINSFEYKKIREAREKKPQNIFINSQALFKKDTWVSDEN